MIDWATEHSELGAEIFFGTPVPTRVVEKFTALSNRKFYYRVHRSQMNSRTLFLLRYYVSMHAYVLLRGGRKFFQI